METPKGDFVSDAHPTSGMVSVNEDQSVLTLTNFIFNMFGMDILPIINKETGNKY